MLSPVDARNLRVGDMRRDPVGTWFEVARAKTGRAAKGTVSKRVYRILRALLDAVPVDVGPIFRNRAGRSYTKDQLGDDFRVMRSALFGAEETPPASRLPPLRRQRRPPGCRPSGTCGSGPAPWSRGRWL